MNKSNLNRILVLIVMAIMIVPIGMGLTVAQETSVSDITHETSTTKTGLERGAVTGKDSKTYTIQENSPMEFPGFDFETLAGLSMEGSTTQFLGKDPNVAFTSMTGLPQWTPSRGSRDADDNQANAVELTHNQAALNTSVGTSTDLQDWYKINLNVNTNKHDQVEIKIHNWNTTNVLSAVMFDNSGSHPWQLTQYPFLPYPLVSNIQRTVFTSQTTTENVGGIDPETNFTMTARAPISGWVYMLIWSAAAGVKIDYEIQNVKITAMNPIDQNNDWTQASKETNKNFLGTLNQAVNHWNWHNISSHFGNTGPDYENNISYTMTVTTENAGSIPVSSGSANWFTWTAATVLFNDNEDNWWIAHNWFLSGCSRNVNDGQNPSNPRAFWALTNGTYAYMGIEAYSGCIGPLGNNAAIYWYKDNGVSSYSVAVDVENIDLNFQPQLNFGKVTPKQGYDTENFTFEVKWTDLNNEPPDTIKVIVDDSKEFDMTPQDGQTLNYDDGVIYEVMVKGEAIGDDPYPHLYRFEADDGRKIAIGDTATHNDLFIISNLPPTPNENRPLEKVLNEDDPPIFLDLYDMFYDPDGDTDIEHDTDGMTLDFRIRDADDLAWGTSFRNDFIDITLYETGDYKNMIKIMPIENKYGTDTIKLKAIDEVQYEEDKFQHEVETELKITVEEVNDGPKMEGISDFTKLGNGVVKEDDTWTYTFNATDVDDPVLMFTTDIEEVFIIDGENVLKTSPEQYGYSFDAFTGEISLTPTNEFVGIHTINVSVTDNDLGKPLYDYDEFVLEIVNTNDAPTITAVGKKDVIPGTTLVFEAKQGKELELEFFAIDPDIEIGESDSLTFHLEDQRDNLILDEDRGILTFTPTQEDVESKTITLEIFVRDKSQAEDSVEIRIRIENVNDPPEVDGVELIIDDADISTPQAENLTIKFKVINARDPDGDTISYSWDFDTSVNLDHVGGSDDDNELLGMENIFHVYPKEGIYYGVLTVKDAIGATVKVNFTVEAKEPKVNYEPPPPPPSGEEESIAGLGKYGGVDAAYWIVILVVVIVVTLVIVMFVIRKKKEEIEKMRHAERFRQEETMDEGRVDEFEPTAAATFEEPQAAKSAAELYSGDTGTIPSLLDMPPPQLPAGGPMMQQQGAPPGGMPPQQQPPQQPQPQMLGLPPAPQPATPVQPAAPAAQPGAAAATDMKCTSCGTPINPEWFICPGCHRFLK